MKLQLKGLDLNIQLIDSKYSLNKKISNISEYADFFRIQKETNSLAIEQTTAYWKVNRPSFSDLFSKQIVVIDIRDYTEEDLVSLDVTSSAVVFMDHICAEHMTFQALTCSASISHSRFTTLSYIGENCSLKLSDVIINNEADIRIHSGSLLWSNAPGNMLLDIKTLIGSASYKGTRISSPGVFHYGTPGPKIIVSCDGGSIKMD